MGLTHLRSILHKHRRIAIDTNIFIYHVEAKLPYLEFTREIFTWLERPPHTAVTSTITMTELMAYPYRTENQMLINRYFGLFSAFPNLEWLPPDLAIADSAAQLRAQYGLRTPDALQVATGIKGSATAFITNDRQLARVSQIEVGVLELLQQM